MMDKTSKLILDKLISAGKGTDYICAFDDAWANQADIVIDDFAKSLNMRTEDVRAAVRKLKQDGWLEYQQVAKQEKPAGFHLSHAGLNYKEIKRIETIKFIKRSILTPIAVSFATTILTVNLWPSIQSMLKSLLL